MSETQQVEETVEEKEFSTTDIYFSAFLRAVGVELVRAEAKKISNGKKPKVLFVFKLAPDKMKRLKVGYFNGTADVKAFRYSQEVRAFKQMCFVDTDSG